MIQSIVITLALKEGRRGGHSGRTFNFTSRSSTRIKLRVCKPKGTVSRTFFKCGNNLKLTAILWISTRGTRTHLRHLTDVTCSRLNKLISQTITCTLKHTRLTPLSFEFTLPNAYRAQVNKHHLKNNRLWQPSRQGRSVLSA